MATDAVVNVSGYRSTVDYVVVCMVVLAIFKARADSVAAAAEAA